MSNDKPIVLRIPKTPNEVWVSNGDTQVELNELLLALGNHYNLDVWYNGNQVHKAVRDEIVKQKASS